MTDSDRNMRTLIVCFVLALVGLIPMRIGAGGVLDSESKVLGETNQVVVENTTGSEVILPEVGGLQY